MDKWLKYGTAVVIVLALAAIGTAWQIGLEHSLENYETKYSLSQEYVIARKPVVEPLTQRIILVILDKLEEDIPQQMPFLAALRNEGAYRPLTARPPLQTKPRYAVISSGAWPEINGVVTDTFPRQIPADNIFRRIKEASMDTAAVAHHWWQDLNGHYFAAESSFYAYSDPPEPLLDQRIFRQGLDLVHNSTAELVLIQFAGQESAPRIDRFIEGLAAELSWNTDTLIIASENSLFAFGNAISHGQFVQAKLTDLTCTIAALLGIMPPTEAQGRILWDILNVPANIRATLARSQSQLLSEFVSYYTLTLGYHKVVRRSLSEAALLIDEADRFSRTAMYEAAFEKAVNAETTLAQTLEDVRHDIIWRGRWLRLPIVLVILAAVAVGVWRLDLRHRILLGSGLLVHAGLFWFLYLAVFTAYTSHLLSIVIPSYLALIGTLAAVWGLRLALDRTKLFTPQSNDYWEILTDYFSGIAGAFSWLYLLVLWSVLTSGFRASWYYPDPRSVIMGIRALTQAQYLTPALLLPIALPYWHRPREGNESPKNGELTLNA